MKTKIAHMEFWRRQYRCNMLQVLWLTGMNEEQYTTLQFETGLDWLQHHTGDDRSLLHELMHNEIIWQWWKNEWNRRDHEQYLPSLFYVHKKERLSRYRAMHQQIFTRLAPPCNLLEISYAKAIGEMFDEK